MLLTYRGKVVCEEIVQRGPSILQIYEREYCTASGYPFEA
jgi:hypothetical protein